MYHVKLSKANPWIIIDWAGNLMDYGRFCSFEDAEEFLTLRLVDNYDTDRQEYEIVKDTK